MKILIKNLLRKIILFLIQFIEKWEYRKLNLDENNYSKKILDTINLKDYKVNGKYGFKNISKIHKTQPYALWELKLNNGLYLEGADNHVLFNENNKEIFIKDLKIGDKIITKYGISSVNKIKKTKFKISMYDITVDSDDHTFYSNEILSHNTTTITALFAWYLCFHVDRNLAILANKEKTAIEIVSKVTDVFKGLPFFLKPGIVNIGATGMKLDNGCMLISQATTKTAQIGFTIHVLYMDEFAHIQNNIARDFWRSVYPTLSSSLISQCIISSTPNGQNNLFFEIWDKSIKGLNSFVNHRVDYWEVPGHDDEWAAQMKKDFGEEEFAQEFGLQFNVTSKLLLAASHLSFIKRIEQEYIFKELSKTKLDDELYRKLKWRMDFDPDADFDIKKDFFVISIDTSEGKEEGEKKENDYNVAKIYKLELKSLAYLRKLRIDEYQLKNMIRLREIGIYRDNLKDDANMAKVCRALVFDQFGEDLCRVLIEMNFNGKNFLTHFSINNDKYYDDVVIHTYHTKPIPGEKHPPKKPGFKVTKDKEHFCKLGKKLIGERTIVPNDTETVREFSSFGKDKKGNYKGLGCHDDTVMATLNISRLYENEGYDDMLYDFLDNYPDCKEKRKIQELLQLDSEVNQDLNDEMFNALYKEENNEMQRIQNIFNDPNRKDLRYTPSSTLGYK